MQQFSIFELIIPAVVSGYLYTCSNFLFQPALLSLQTFTSNAAIVAKIYLTFTDIEQSCQNEV